MSKYLVRILAVCAFVVMLPLVIIASALGVTESAACTLELLLLGDVAGNATLFIDGTEAKTTTVVKNSVVELGITMEDGYHFTGWFNGTDTTSKAVSTTAYFDYKVSGNKKLTAVFNPNEYKIKYTGYKEDGVTDIGLNEEVVNFNGELAEPVKNDPNSSIAFAGWMIEGDQSGNVYTSADFVRDNNAEITLVAIWGNVKTVAYYDQNGDVIANSTKVLNKEQFETYELIDGSSAVNAGYTFNGWLVKSTGNDAQEYLNTLKGKEDFTFERIELVPNAQIINYSVSSALYAGAPEEKNVKFDYDVTKDFDLTKFQRTGYSLTGFKIGENSVSVKENNFQSNIRSAIIAAGNNENEYAVEMTAVWEFNWRDYGSVKTTEVPIYFDLGKNAESVVAYKGEESIRLTTFWLEFADEEGCLKLEDAVVSVIEGYTFKDKNGNDVTLKNFRIAVTEGTEEPAIFDSLEFTFGETLSVVNQLGGWNKVCIRFIFE